MTGHLRNAHVAQSDEQTAAQHCLVASDTRSARPKHTRTDQEASQMITRRISHLDMHLLCHGCQFKPMLQRQHIAQRDFLHLAVRGLVSLDCC